MRVANITNTRFYNKQQNLNLQSGLYSKESYHSNNNNYNYIKDINFKGKLNLKRYNPAYRFCLKLFQRSQIASRRRFSPPINGMKGILKEINIPLKNRKSIVAYDINPNNTDKYIVFFHGTSQNISNCQKIYKEFLNAKYAVLAPEYSGFGKNKNRMADEYTLEDDIMGTIKYLKKKKIKPENIGIVGHSLGGYAATRTAEEIPQAKFLILISPVNSLSYEIPNIVNNRKFKIPKIFQFIYKHYPKILNPLERIFKTEERINGTKVPLYIIHSANDNLIPVKSSKALALKSKSLRNLTILDSGGHRLDETKLNAIKEILSKI